MVQYKIHSTGNHVQVFVDSIPICQVCMHMYRDSHDAQYDAYIPAYGQWGYICRKQFIRFKCQVGLGKGQELVLRKEWS